MIYKSLRLMTVMSVASVLSSACKETAEIVPMTVTSGNIEFPLQLSVQPFDDESNEVTKGYLEDAGSLVSDINYLVYDQNGILVESASHYESDVTGNDSLTLPYQGDFDIYAFANVGNLSGQYPPNVKGLETFGYSYSSYETIREKGLPMAGKLHCKSGMAANSQLSLTRLATRLALSFDKSGLEQRFRAGTYVTSIDIKQGALDIYPFASGGSKATRTTANGDYSLSTAGRNDLKTLNDGGTIYLYVLTNMQGALLPEDYEQKDKTEEMMEMYLDSDEYALLTYLEMHCKVDSPSAIFEDVICRHYIGGNESEGPDNYNCSFNIYPGIHRDIALCLSGGEVIRQSWRLEPGKGMGKSGLLRIIPQATYPMVAPPDPSRPSTTGVTAIMDVTHPSGIAYKVEIDDNSMGLKYSRSALSSTKDRYVFSTDKLVTDSYILPCDTDGSFPMNEDEYPNNVKDVKVTFRAVELDYAESITILCLNSFLGCVYTLDADSPMFSVFNRAGLTFRCSLNATIRSDKGYTSELGQGANPFIFNIQPKWGEEDMFAEERFVKGYFAQGPSILPIFDMGGNLNGCLANLEISCKEYPGLVIKYGGEPLEYYKVSGTLLNYKALRMSYKNKNGLKYLKTDRIGPNQQPLTWLESNYQTHYVNGEPEIKVITER